MSTKHSKAAAEFLKNKKQAAWHDETLWLVRAKPICSSGFWGGIKPR